MSQFTPLDETASNYGGPKKRKQTGQRRKSKTSGSPGNRIVAPLKKHFILDTNVLLHAPNCIGRFADNHVCIPVDVLAELDRFKNEQSDRGANARAVHRALTAAFSEPEASVTDGVDTAGGGSLRIVLFEMPGHSKKPAWFTQFKRVFTDIESIDHRIIATALRLDKNCHESVILVTKDLNMQLKARSVGLACEDYQNDKVEPAEVSTYDMRTVEIGTHGLQRFASSGSFELSPENLEKSALFHPNEYVLLSSGEKKMMPARHVGEGTFRRLFNVPKSISIPGGMAIKPINLGQQCLLDALLDPDISLVTCYGHAGTGKTLMAIAAGLHAVFAGDYRGLTISRPVVSMGDTLGFLPGTLDEKMHPWLQPIYDALEFLLPVGGDQPAKKKVAKQKSGTQPQPKQLPGTGGKKPYETLIESGVIEVEALCYIRGRSIPQRFFVLDEAQQLTPLEAKTVVTRMSKNSKLVMVGDPAQIDNPYVDSRSNGLVYTRDRLRPASVSAHVPLSKGERSELAELGATLM